MTRLGPRARRAAGGGGFFREPLAGAEEFDVAPGAVDRHSDGQRPCLDEKCAAPLLLLLPVPAGDMKLAAGGVDLLDVDQLAGELNAGRAFHALELQDALRPAGQLRLRERVE